MGKVIALFEGEGIFIFIFDEFLKL